MKPRLAGVNAALKVAAAALVTVALLFCAFPRRHLFRGEEELAVILTGCCAVLLVSWLRRR
jgi:hypothetical protein